VPGLDYEMSYLQGRVLLRAPMPSVADSSTLVQVGSLSGNPVFIVATYEYAPGLNEIESNVYGLRNSSWVNDHLRLGVSGYRQGDDLDRQTVGGIDATVRLRPATYIDFEAARSDGMSSMLSSIDGGFGVNQSATADVRADARRVQGVFDLAAWRDGARGRQCLLAGARRGLFRSGRVGAGTGDRADGRGVQRAGELADVDPAEGGRAGRRSAERARRGGHAASSVDRALGDERRRAP
jgi:hypothetical protein